MPSAIWDALKPFAPAGTENRPPPPGLDQPSEAYRQEIDRLMHEDKLNDGYAKRQQRKALELQNADKWQFP